MRPWILLLVAAALGAVSCSTSDEAAEPDIRVTAELSAQAVVDACSNACDAYELVYVQDELVKLGGFAN